ncbi:MAG: AtpZ/AtpI family protein [Thermoanaerobaculia bacterium]|nr:AtpZ/AtpI family protein [Thermoanaerobaculia bacterium]
MNGKRPRYAAVAEASTAGILFPACLVVGFVVGKWIGRVLGWGTAPAFVGAALGVAAAFWNLYRILRRAERSD